MAKQHWKGSVLLAPVPPALVTCGTLEHPNVLTVAWTGVVSTHPPMTYVSIRPSRYSYSIIEQQKEFVINLTTSAMCRETDFCGVKSGRDVDKIAACNFTLEPGQTVSTPSIEQCPVNLECKVTEAKAFGSHTMFLAESLVSTSRSNIWTARESSTYSNAVLWHMPMESILRWAESWATSDGLFAKRKSERRLRKPFVLVQNRLTFFHFML